MGCCISTDAIPVIPTDRGAKKEINDANERTVFLPKNIKGIRLTELHNLYNIGQLTPFLNVHIYTRNFKLTPDNTTESPYSYNDVIHDNSTIAQVILWKNPQFDHIIGLDWEDPLSNKLLQQIALTRSSLLKNPYVHKEDYRV